MSRILCLAVVALAASPASAQFLNRAVWLGSDQEGVRRDYDQGVDYFLDRTSYVDVAPWHRPSLDPFVDRLFFATGSVSSRRLTIEGTANVGVDLGDGFAARIAYLQSENQSTQFARFGTGLEKRLGDATAVFVLLEGTPDKGRADLSFGAELFRSAHGAHRITVTLVDFASNKATEFEYETAPVGLMFAGFAGDPESFEFGYELGVQLPFEERELDSGDLFSMARGIGSLQGRLRIAERDRLILALDGEVAAKELRPTAVGAAEREDLDTGLVRARLEWWRSGDDGRELSVAALWNRLRNDGERPNAPDQDLAERRDELLLFGRARVPLSESWTIEPYVLGGYVRYDEGIADPSAGQFDGFQGKFGVPVAYVFSPRAFLRVDLSFQLDEFAFGGGGVQFQATF